MNIIRTLVVTLGCTLPALAQAQSPAEKYVVRVDVVDAGKTLTAPRFVLAAGGSGRMSVSKDIPVDRVGMGESTPNFQAAVSLPPASSMDTGQFPVHLALGRFVNGSWVAIADRDVAVRLGQASTLQAPAPPGAASGENLTLVIDVARFEKGAGAP